MKLEEGAHFHDRPALDIVIRKFRAAKITAYIAGVFFTCLFVCVWPGTMLSLDVMDGYGFKVWTTLSRGWAFVAATFIIIVPLVQEVVAIKRQHSLNKRNAEAAGDEQPQQSRRSSTGGQSKKSESTLYSVVHSYFTLLFSDIFRRQLQKTANRVLGK